MDTDSGNTLVTVTYYSDSETNKTQPVITTQVLTKNSDNVPSKYFTVLSYHKRTNIKSIG